MTLTASIDADLDVALTTRGASFPTREAVRSAAASFPRSLPSWDGREGPRWRLTVAPGVVTLGTRDPARAERAADRALRRHKARVALLALDELLPDRLADALDTEAAILALANGLGCWDRVPAAVELVELLQARLELVREHRAAGGAAGYRGAVVSWSRRSRSRMVRVLGSLDYRPLFEQGIPAMLTLTYPGGWLAVAPDARTCARHVDALRKRFARHYGRPLIGVWKREFQARGAPHYHVLMVPPAPVNGEHFRSWVSRTWADIVDASGADRALHERAGTGLDYAEGMRARDPKRLAVYFSKHGIFAAKDYQNTPPVEWADRGGVGRYWGVWGLHKCEAVAELPADDAITTARVMRRWARANGYIRRERVYRPAGCYDPATGELVKNPWRYARRRVSRLARQDRGFLIVNDGPRFASQLARAVART